MQLLPPLLPLQLARPFLLAFEWATRHPPVLLHNLPTLGIGDIKWVGTMAPLETARCKINLLLDKGSGGQEQRHCPRQRTQGHPPTRLEVHPDLHQFTGALESLLGAPTTCKVVARLVADQIWCTTCTEPHTRKQASSSTDSDYHPCPPAHQRFFVALARSPKAAHRKYEYTVGSCYETVRLFTHGGHLPRLPHWPDNRQCW